MKDNEEIVYVIEIKRQIDLAKVRICATHPITKVLTFRTGFVSKALLSAEDIANYYHAIEGDCLNPFEQDAEAFARLNS